MTAFKIDDLLVLTLNDNSRGKLTKMYVLLQQKAQDDGRDSEGDNE